MSVFEQSISPQALHDAIKECRKQEQRMSTLGSNKNFLGSDHIFSLESTQLYTPLQPNEH